MPSSTRTAAAPALPRVTPAPLKWLLAATIFYIPNQSHFPDFSLVAVNITNLLFVALLLLLLAYRDKAQPPDPAPLKGAFVFFFAVMTWGFVIGQVYDASTTLADLAVLKNIIVYMLFFFIAYHAVRDDKTIRFLFFVILFTVFVDVYLGFRQAQDYGFSFNVARRVAAPFSWDTADANRSSAYYALYIALLAVTALYWRGSVTVRVMALAVALFGVFVDYFTLSRQSYIILAVLALVLALRRNALLAVVVLIALMNYSHWLPAGVVQRIDSAFSTQSAMPGTVGSGTTLQQQIATASDQRYLIWSGAQKMIERAPWGIGLNHFARDIGNYAPAAAGQDANGYYVLCTTEDGLLAPVAMLVLLWGLFKLGRSVERIDDSPQSKVYGVGLWLMVITVAMVNLYGSRFVDGNLMTNFWIFAGMVARYRALRQPAPAQPRRAAGAQPDWPQTAAGAVAQKAAGALRAR